MRLLLLAALAVLLVPAAAAGDDVREWTQVEQFESQCGVCSKSYSVTADERPHDWNVTADRLTLKVYASYSLNAPGLTGAETRYAVTLVGPEGQTSQCTWNVRAFDSATTSHAVTHICGTYDHVVTPGDSFDIYVNGTAISGSDFLRQATYTFELQHQESIIMDIAVATAFDAYIPVLFWGGMLLLALWQGWLLFGTFSTLGLIASFFEVFPLGFVGVVFLLILGIWAEYLARHLKALKESRPIGD